MHLYRTILGLLAASFLASCVFAQSGTTAQPQVAPEDRSFYLNRPVVHPEALSGIWEAPDGHGGAVGIQLQLATTLPGDASPPLWTPQSWLDLEVGVFERTGPEIKSGEESGFSDSVRGGGALFQKNRLQLHFVSEPKDAPSLDLDLLLQLNGCWHGRFRRGAFDSVVELCRPTPGHQSVLSPLVGTWFQTSGAGWDCIHIVQTSPATLTAWSDSLMIPGSIRFGANIPGPHLLYERFGALAKVDPAGNQQVSVEFGAYNPICCSHRFIGMLSADGTTLRGAYPPGPNQTSRAATFTRMHGESCVDSAVLHSYEPAHCPSGAK